jgi:predicted SAM-dependent methyltransferase
MKLNLGCCDRAIPGFLGVDIAPGPLVDQVADLSKRWPWDDSSVDEIMALDVVEHLPNRVHTWNELWRVLKNGGKATIETPNAAKGAGFYQDPTHVSPYCMNSFQYVEAGSFAHKRLAASYGIRASFKIVELTEHPYQDVREQVWKIKAVLRAVK